MRLIDASALFDKQMEMMETLIKSTLEENMSQEALSLLCGVQLTLNAPTVDAVPVVHGRIVIDPDNGEVYCTACNTEPIPTWAQYCPHCGAKMDGGMENGEG